MHKSRTDISRCRAWNRAEGASRTRNTRPRIRDCDLRPRRPLHDLSPQVTSGATTTRSTELRRATVFTQTDPAPAEEGSQFESAYSYVSGRPGTTVDPSGWRGQLPRTRGFDANPYPKPEAPPAAGPKAPPGAPPIVIFVWGTGETEEPVIRPDEWPENQKKRPRALRNGLNTKRILFRAGNNTGKNFTPRPGKDTSGYPMNGLSTYKYPRGCNDKCQILDVDILESRPGMLALQLDPKDPLHVFIQAVTQEYHDDWAASRVDEQSAADDPRTQAVRSARIGFWGFLKQAM
jgi:hypothetical protein